MLKPITHNTVCIYPRFCQWCCICCRCAGRRTNCEACTVACARNMENYRGGHRCNITGDDPDNGQSPRLRYCYSCCNKRECDKLCEVYHDPQCQQIRWELRWSNMPQICKDFQTLAQRRYLDHDNWTKCNLISLFKHIAFPFNIMLIVCAIFS